MGAGPVGVRCAFCGCAGLPYPPGWVCASGHAESYDGTHWIWFGEWQGWTVKEEEDGREED